MEAVLITHKLTFFFQTSFTIRGKNIYSLKRTSCSLWHKINLKKFNRQNRTNN